MDYLNTQKIYDLISSGQIAPLESEFEIEDLIKMINSFDTNLDFYEGLKKNRAATIDYEMQKIENKKEFLKKVVLATLEKFNKKSLSFPGIGKVTAKDLDGKWIINDEEELIKTLRQELPQADFDKIVQKKNVVVKKEINTILDGWEKINKCPSCVSKETPKKTLTIKIEKDADLEVVEIDEESDVLADKPEVSNSDTSGGYDTLETEF